jgi:NAD(P)H-dependent FMN reductase
VRLLLVTGSTRRGSTNTAALRAVHELVRPAGAETVLYEDLATLPHFDPDADHDPLPAAVASLRAEIARADAVVFCTPEYAGTLPGAFKNLLDWTVGGGEMDRRPVSWINVAPAGRGGGADATLSTVLGYVNAAVLASGAPGSPSRARRSTTTARSRMTACCGSWRRRSRRSWRRRAPRAASRIVRGWRPSGGQRVPPFAPSPAARPANIQPARECGGAQLGIPSTRRVLRIPR